MALRPDLGIQRLGPMVRRSHPGERATHLCARTDESSHLAGVDRPACAYSYRGRGRGRGRGRTTIGRRASADNHRQTRGRGRPSAGARAGAGADADNHRGGTREGPIIGRAGCRQTSCGVRGRINNEPRSRADERRAAPGGTRTTSRARGQTNDGPSPSPSPGAGRRPRITDRRSPLTAHRSPVAGRWSPVTDDHHRRAAIVSGRRVPATASPTTRAARHESGGGGARLRTPVRRWSSDRRGETGVGERLHTRVLVIGRPDDEVTGGCRARSEGSGAGPLADRRSRDTRELPSNHPQGFQVLRIRQGPVHRIATGSRPSLWLRRKDRSECNPGLSGVPTNGIR